MKIGDLVRWSEVNIIWHQIHHYPEHLLHVRRRGIIIDENPEYYFVFWENAERAAERAENLEIVNEAR